MTRKDAFEWKSCAVGHVHIEWWYDSPCPACAARVNSIALEAFFHRFSPTYFPADATRANCESLRIFEDAAAVVGAGSEPRQP